MKLYYFYRIEKYFLLYLLKFLYFKNKTKALQFEKNRFMCKIFIHVKLYLFI